jgi:hypothetical protein
MFLTRSTPSTIRGRGYRVAAGFSAADADVFGAEIADVFSELSTAAAADVFRRSGGSYPQPVNGCGLHPKTTSAVASKHPVSYSFKLYRYVFHPIVKVILEILHI